MPMRTASRLDAIAPFYVMEVAKAAARIGASPACDPALGGTPMVWMNIGEPDFGPPTAVREAAARLVLGPTPYTQATGLPELREAIAAWYGRHFGVPVSPQRIVVTAGASAALQLATLALFEPGDEVLLPDPSYPCNRHFVAAAGARAVLLEAGAESRFQPTPEAIEAAWTPATRGVLLASPSNPTGTSIEPAALARIAAHARDRGGITLVDEIYLPLSFDERYAGTALALRDSAGRPLSEHIVSINSFSKYFGMTGWRLGWLVLPEALVAPVEKLAQNLYICASSVAQHAAIEAFTPASIAECEARRATFRARRDLVVPALEAMRLVVPVAPDGAFYAWTDVSAHAASSWDFCFRLMEEAHVALTPGRDFGPAAAERFVRLSFATATHEIEAALDRMRRLLA
jgi:aspartate/methionine/tyrosine aminotransferase